MNLQEIRNQAERLENYQLTKKEFFHNLKYGLLALFVVIVLKILLLI